jgi:hypothetical protein
MLFFVGHPRLDHQFVWNFSYSIKNLDLLKINKENESFVICHLVHKKENQFDHSYRLVIHEPIGIFT